MLTSSNKISRIPVSVLTGETAMSLMINVFPFSIATCNSSPTLGLPKKKRVGKTLPKHLKNQFQLRQTTASQHLREITVFADPVAELLEDLGVHAVRQDICRGDARPVLLGEILAGLLKVVRSHVNSGPALDRLLATQDLGAQGLREALVGNTKVTLEELDNTGSGRSISVPSCVALENGAHELGKSSLSAWSMTSCFESLLAVRN